MKKLFLILISLLVVPTVYSQKEKNIDWIKDLDYLQKELPEKHYNLYSIQSEEEFLSGIKAIKAESKKLTSLEIALRIQQLIAKCGDSHTGFNFYPLLDKKQMLPFSLFWGSDGLHVLNTTRENKELLGRQIVSINELPIATVIDSLSTLFAIDNAATVKLKTPNLVSSFQVLEYFGFVKDKEVKLMLDQNETYILKPSAVNKKDIVSVRPDSVAFCVRNQRVFFTDCYYPDEKIFYMLYNVCWSREIQMEFGDKDKAASLPSFKEFEEKAFDVLNNKAVDKIVFDLRYNNGGNSSQGTEFIEKLANFLDRNPHVKMYVVLGRSTFSSAILNAMDFKKMTNALFVGEETSGKPNHFGEVRSFQLPTSGLNVDFSTNYFQQTEENVNTIAPDVNIEMSFSDYMKGIDPIYEWIKRQ